MKEDATEYLEEDQLKTLIKRYSEFINFPIFLQETKTEEIEVPLSLSRSLHFRCYSPAQS